MDNLFEELLKGFFRGIGYILAEIFFGTICYWVGWPVCKLMTLGKYPKSSQVVYLENTRSEHGWGCSVVGMLVLLILFVTYVVKAG